LLSTPKEITMFRFTPKSNAVARARRRNQRLNCEALESRQLLTNYYIVNSASGKVLDDPNFSTGNGTQMDQWQLNGGTNQEWQLVPLADGNYEIVNVYSGKLLDDESASKSNGNPIIQYQYSGGGLNQQWRMEKLNNGTDWIINACSNLLLDDANASTSNGNPIIQYQFTGGANQMWIVVAAGNTPATTNYVVDAYSAKALDDPSSSTTNGTVIVQNHLNLGADQRWVFVPLANGNDLIVNVSSGKVLDDPAASNANGTLMDQWQLSGGLNQQWKIVAQPDGNVEVSNASSGKVLDDTYVAGICNYSNDDGIPIRQNQWNGSTNQQWNISPFANPVADAPYWPAPAGTPLFQNSGPSYLDVAQGRTGDCWLMAALAEVAARYPQDIKNMFTYDGTTVDNGATVGLYTVRLYTTQGWPIFVQVDTEFPSGGSWYDHVANLLGTQVLWAALAEKAYAVANGVGVVGSNNESQDAYDSLGGGDPADALHAITNYPADDYLINTTDITNDWNAGCLIVLGTTTPSSSYIQGNHAYAVVGCGTNYQVFNPWGTDHYGWAAGHYGTKSGLFWADATFISQNFSGQSIGTGAINVNDAGERVIGLAELGTLEGGDNPVTSHLDELAEQMVLSGTSPTLTKLRSLSRRL
jgi:hypothetical protein